MRKEEDRLINDFKTMLEEYSEPADAGQWEQLESDIIRQTRKIKLRKYYYSIAAAVVCLLGLTAGLISLYTNHLDQPEAELQAQVEAGAGASEETVENIAATTISVIEVEKPAIAQNIVLRATSDEVLPILEKTAMHETQQDIAEGKTELEEPAPQKKGQDLEEEMEITEQIIADQFSQIEEEIPQKPKTKIRGRGFSLSFSGNGPASSVVSVDATSVTSIDISKVQFLAPANTAFSDRPQMVMANAPNARTASKSYDYRFSVPVSFGLYAQKKLNGGFWLETGLFATKMSTSFILDAADSPALGKNVMWYVGIPLKAGWSFFESRYFTSYLTAGASIEKCVSSVYSGEQLYFEDAAIESTSALESGIFPLQFSVNGAIGIQYNIVKSVSLFMEPGVSYYFVDDTPVPTLRTAKPLYINILCGLRFNF